jgi:predicted anti-sigma-YlaC factor YlaD
MNRHLTDEEILDLLAPGAEANLAIREHLAACDACRTRIESERTLSDRVAELPRAKDTPRDLWPTVRDRLATAEHRSRRPRRSRITLLQAAAAVAIFFLGALSGRTLDADSDPLRSTPNDPLLAAAEVQRTGTAYVAAVAHFRAVAADSAPGAVAQAREVALAAVHGAAFELARLHPDDPTAREILALARDHRRTGNAR